MTKQLFISSIEALRLQYEHDRNCIKAFATILPDCHVSGYDNHRLTNKLVGLLQAAMDDEGKDSWIEYYLYELDFGAKYKAGCATNADGSNIDLSTPETLYDFLTLKN